MIHKQQTSKNCFISFFKVGLFRDAFHQRVNFWNHSIAQLCNHHISFTYFDSLFNFQFQLKIKRTNKILQGEIHLY